MNYRTAAPPPILAAALMFLMVFWLLVAFCTAFAAPSVNAQASPPSASSSSSTKPIQLAPSITAHPMTSARAALLAAGAYVHLANCRDALQGANGDNDIVNYIVSHSPWGIKAWAWSNYTRFANDDIVQYINFYNNAGWISNGAGRCWGSDANISDNVYD